jgi:hypothetical protein
MRHRRLGVDLSRLKAGARREAVNLTVLCSTILSDLIENRRGENGLDQPAGASQDPD